MKMELRKIIDTMKNMTEKAFLVSLETPSDPMGKVRHDIVGIVFDNFSQRLLVYLANMSPKEIVIEYDKVVELVDSIKKEVDEQNKDPKLPQTTTAARMIHEILDDFHTQLLADPGGVSESGQMILPNPGSIN